MKTLNDSLNPQCGSRTRTLRVTTSQEAKSCEEFHMPICMYSNRILHHS